MANHIPYGYRIENGVAVIDEGQAEQVRNPVPQRCKKDTPERALPGR